MKFAVAYYLLLIYATVILKPIIPLAEDSLSHCFAEAYHVATVHAIYGNNHVDVALADDAKDDTNNKNQTTSKTGEQDTVHISIKEQTPAFVVKIQPEKIFVYTSDKPCTIFLLKNVPPPKFLI